jgi:hypothetical protein
MLEIHAKIHEIPNGDQQQQQHNDYEFNQPLPGQQLRGNNGYSMDNVTTSLDSTQQQQPYYQPPMLIDDDAAAEEKPPTTEMANLHPMNLSIDRSWTEPMDLSNDKLEQSKSYIHTEVKMADSDDDEGGGLQIVEDSDRTIHIEPSSAATNLNAVEEMEEQKFSQMTQFQPASLIPLLPIKIEEPLMLSDQEAPELKINDNELKINDQMQFPLIGASRMATSIELDSLRDLPSEIFQQND